MYLLIFRDTGFLRFVLWEDVSKQLTVDWLAWMLLGNRGSLIIRSLSSIKISHRHYQRLSPWWFEMLPSWQHFFMKPPFSHSLYNSDCFCNIKLLPPSLPAWVWSLGLTCFKEKTGSHRLSSDLHIHTHKQMWLRTLSNAWATISL